MIPFQHGVTLSSKSAIFLLHDLKQRFALNFLLTRQRNQDVLENLFGIICQMGRTNNYPCPLSFKQRLKSYILSHKHTLVSLQPNAIMRKYVKCTALLLA